MRIAILTVNFILSFNFSFAQSILQTIRGTVTDGANSVALSNATISVISLKQPLVTKTDPSGNFIIHNVPVGRIDLQISFVGYEPRVIREIEVGSGKEVVLNITLIEDIRSLEAVVVKAGQPKDKAINNMALASARMLSAEEAKRYAGGFDDPARLVSSFAGVASNVANNGIVVRGNAPKALQWKMEGVEIPNPNHFADLATFGGGGLTAMSSQLLANSDFLSGAFPAEYSNALSGIFDINMRKGNSNEREHTFQLGLTGIDIGSEGPFKKGKSSSYLFNYRYSTLSLLGPILPEGASGNNYQDLSFKLNFPTAKAGTFSLWGIGLIDKTGQDAKTDMDKWEYETDRSEQDGKLYMGAAGLSHKINTNKKSFLKTTIAATTDGIDFKNSILNNSLILHPDYRIKNRFTNIILSSFLNTKFSSRHINKTGFTITDMYYDLDMKEAPSTGSALQTVVKQKDNSGLLSGYSSSFIRLNDKLTMTAGINAQLFTLNRNYSIEPRFGLQWKFNKDQSLTFAYGKHSRLEKIFYYFMQSPTGTLLNKDLDLTKAHHFVAGYNKKINNNLNLKIEAYYQQIYDVPVIRDSTFSLLNVQNNWFVYTPLVNEGKGKNYGVELTLERYLSGGFYFLSTVSVFDSKYKNENDKWRDTRYNRNFVTNLLAGKEWRTGKIKQNSFGLNVRGSYQGGDRYSPVDINKSLQDKEVVYDERSAFTKQYPAFFTGHLTINYKINRKKTSQELSLKLINITGYKERYGFGYNFKTNTVDEIREAVIIPNISYKIEF